MQLSSFFVALFTLFLFTSCIEYECSVGFRVSMREKFQVQISECS